MKGKPTSHSDIRILLTYVYKIEDEAAERPSWISGSVSGNLEDQIALFLSAARRLKKRKPYIHMMLSPHPDDVLDGYHYSLIARQLIASLGFPIDTPFAVVMHNDTKIQHLHIVICAISFSGELYRGDRKQRLSTLVMAECEKLERIYGLRITPTWRDKARQPRPAIIVPKPRSDRGKGYIPEITSMQSDILGAIDIAVDWEQLVALLHMKDISVIWRDAGVSYKRIYAMKASSLGSAFMAGALEARNLIPRIPEDILDPWEDPARQVDDEAPRPVGADEEDLAEEVNESPSEQPNG